MKNGGDVDVHFDGQTVVVTVYIHWIIEFISKEISAIYLNLKRFTSNFLYFPLLRTCTYGIVGTCSCGCLINMYMSFHMSLTMKA